MCLTCLFSVLCLSMPRGCSHLTTESVACVAQHCPALTMLNLSGCIALQNSSIQALADQCPALIHLNLTGCKGLTKLPKNLLTACPHLDDLFSAKTKIGQPPESVRRKDCDDESDGDNTRAIKRFFEHLRREEATSASAAADEA